MSASVIVAGLGRCGSSLTMQMLEAGGYPVAGTFPGYEDDEIGALWRKGDNPPVYVGQALKMVDPWRWHTSHTDARIIYCTRDPAEQAKSQIKFAMMLAGMRPDLSAGAVRRMRKALTSDDRRARAWLQRRASAWIELPFEDTINSPVTAAQRIADFLGDLDVSAMANAVRLRTDKCHPSLFELELLRDAA